jgi:ketosteroid isomerase-like protein
VSELTPDDDAAEVEEANARFYRAFESLEVAQMDQVWAHGDHVRCIHPGWCLLSGWDAVRQSWEAIFRDSREMRFSIADVDVHVDGNLAWVTCGENILSQARGQIAVTALLATNVFERRGAEWLMIHHHSSHTLATEPPSQP